MSIRATIPWSLVTAVIVSSSGCQLVPKLLSHSLREASYHFQYNDGRSENGLTDAERRARFEESAMRSILWTEVMENGRSPSPPSGL